MKIKKLRKTSTTQNKDGTCIWQHYEVLRNPEGHSAMMTGNPVEGEFRVTIQNFNKIIVEVVEEG